jgi:tetratricopeptide (TPR) repeat protein
MSSAVTLSGGDPRLTVELGQMHLSRGELAEAARYAERALQADAQLADAWALQGDVFDEKEQLQAALDSYHRALNYSPTDANLQTKVAEAYHRQGRPQRALATLQRLTEQYEPGQEPRHLLYLEGLSLAALNRHEDAVAVLTAASRQGPPSQSIMYDLAQSALKAGRLGSAHWAAKDTLRLGADPRAAELLLAQIESAQQATAPSARR